MGHSLSELAAKLVEAETMKREAERDRAASKKMKEGIDESDRLHGVVLAFMENCARPTCAVFLEGASERLELLRKRSSRWSTDWYRAARDALARQRKANPSAPRGLLRRHEDLTGRIDRYLALEAWVRGYLLS